MIKGKPTKFMIFILTCFVSFISYSQEGTTIVTQDLETWSKLGLKIKPVDWLGIRVNQGFRFNRNSTQLDQMFTELNFKFKASKHLKFGTGFRYISDRGGNGLFDNDFRFNVDALFNHDINKFSFQYRLRYQNRNEIGLTTAEGDYYKNYLRLKMGLTYNIKGWKFDPVFSTEIFRNMTKVTGGFDKLRLTLGTNYKFKNYGKMGVYGRLERELGVSYPKTTTIIGVNYVYTFKKKK